MPQGSAYGANAPAYASTDLQRAQLAGRIDVARGIRDRAALGGDAARAARWSGIVDELLDRLVEVRGR